MSAARDAVAVTGACDLVWVDGPDAASFLQGLLSNDVAALAAGGTCRALLLDATGHIQADLRVARTAPDGFTLVTADGMGAGLAGLLERYHFSEDVDVVGPERFACVTVIGAPGPDHGADLALPGDVPGTTDLIGADAAALLAASGAREAPAGDLEALRVARAVPRFGTDFTSKNLVQEAGLERVAVSFDKGCYLGQETVARVQYRGQVNRRLVQIRLDGPADAGGAVTFEGAPVGTLTSAAVVPGTGALGLAIVRREVPAGARVAVGAAGGTIVDPN